MQPNCKIGRLSRSFPGRKKVLKKYLCVLGIQADISIMANNCGTTADIFGDSIKDSKAELRDLASILERVNSNARNTWEVLRITMFFKTIDNIP